MEIEITVKNYRCFQRPATFRLAHGITAFLGPNNSGKSTILRMLHELRDLFSIASNNANLDQLNLKEGDANYTVFAQISNALMPCLAKGNSSNLSIEFRPVATDDVFKIELDRSGAYEVTAYGGSLAEMFSVLSRCFYIGAFRNVLNVSGEDARHFDIHIGQQLIRKWGQMIGGGNYPEAQGARRVQRILEDVFEFDDLQINAAADSKTLQIWNGNERFDLFELGAGIAHFAVALMNVVLAKPTYILIDEPETGLHPKLQLSLVDALHSFAELGVAFATHNYGLARASTDKLYFVSPTNNGSFVEAFQPSNRLAEFLGEMNFSSYSQLGCEKILLVEGPTDIPVFQHFLRQLRKDHKVVVTHIGGSAGLGSQARIQLQEVKRICPHLAAVLDSERERDTDAIGADRQLFVDACRDEKVDCLIVERRATENYFADAAVKAVFGGDARALDQFESPSDAKWIGFKKSRHNSRIASEMKFDEIAETDLGKFFQDL
jgi:ABC-type multidrug transport system ATPase subunit